METCPLMIYYRCFPPHKSWFRIIVLLYTEEIRRTRCYNLNVGCHYDIPNRAKWKTPSESLLSIGMLVMSKGPMHIAPSIRPKFSADGFEQIRRLATNDGPRSSSSSTYRPDYTEKQLHTTHPVPFSSHSLGTAFANQCHRSEGTKMHAHWKAMLSTANWTARFHHETPLEKGRP